MMDPDVICRKMRGCVVISDHDVGHGVLGSDLDAPLL